MQKRHLTNGAAIALSALVMVVAGAPAIIYAADHLDAPAINGALQSPRGRHDADIADTYAFRSPQHADRTVLAITTHPFLGAITTDPTYGTDISYNIHLDAVAQPGDDETARRGRKDDQGKSDDEGRARQTLQVRFGRADEDGSQPYTVTLIGGSDDDHEVLGHGRTNRVSEIEDGRAFAGKVSDPFFFDLGAFNNTVQNRLTQHILPLNTGKPVNCATQGAVDTFGAANTNAIVLEVPNELLGGKVNVWAATVRSDGTQIDRMARPAINTVFNGKKLLLAEGDDNDKNLFNAIPDPRLDPKAKTTAGATFHDNVVHVLGAFDGVAHAVAGITPRPPATLNAIANVLLPDVLPYDPAVAKTDGVTNGRSLADDVIDNELPLVTNGLVTTDCVGPHHNYRSSFPFLGAPA
ncbi:MAG TPA: DUF4331 family protein [Acidimicrobiales bacterium]|nr:DUF4331 family protein [Acidimicrobiales bacterium]